MNKYLEELQNDEYVREKDLGGNIHSFNFTNKAFFNSEWNSRTLISRGLFVDVNTEQVVARSFDKFFAVDERPETSMDALKDTLAFPVAAYRKENGFLGICSYREGECNNLFLASKSTNQGEYADYFRTIFNDIVKPEIQVQFATWLRMMHCSAVFEVIDPIHDPHIVEYDKPRLVLLALIENEYTYHPYSYWMVEAVARVYGFECKKREAILISWEEFIEFYNKAKQETCIEGYVFEDDKGFMLKLKTDWYKYWKRIRSVIQAINRGMGYFEIREKYKFDSNETVLLSYILNECYANKLQEKQNARIDIPQLRRRFLEYVLPKVEQKILLDS